MVIDCFSKFLFATPLKRKTTDAIIQGFRIIFENTERRPDRLQTDKGGEYDSRKFKSFMKQMDIKYNTTQNPDTKAAISERVIRTIKVKIFKYLTHTNSFKYNDVLDDIIKSYNTGYHRTIKMAPIEVNDCNIVEVYKNIRESQGVPMKLKRPKLKIDDYVRITKYKNVFAKGYLPNWTSEIFIVKDIVKRDPVVYKLVDLEGEDITGVFYEQEVQKIKFQKGMEGAIEKIIKQERKGKNLQYYVKWRGYTSAYNSWLNSKAVLSI